jgi:hypothetical protein
MEQVEVEGFHIAYERAGVLAPPVLLHGYVGGRRHALAGGS